MNDDLMGMIDADMQAASDPMIRQSECNRLLDEQESAWVRKMSALMQRSANLSEENMRLRQKIMIQKTRLDTMKSQMQERLTSVQTQYRNLATRHNKLTELLRDPRVRDFLNRTRAARDLMTMRDDTRDRRNNLRM